jgi:transposase
METKHKNGVTPASSLTAKAKSLEVLEKPKRRRFSIEEKLRILREADACTSGTIGAVLRREGIYSSHLSAWRRQRDGGGLDTGMLRERAKREDEDEDEDEVARRRIAELEREKRKLQRRLQRAELILDIQKKASGLLGIELKSPENDEND